MSCHGLARRAGSAPFWAGWAIMALLVTTLFALLQGSGPTNFARMCTSPVGKALSLDRKLLDTGAFFPGVAPNSTILAEFSTMDTRNDTQEPVVSGTASTSEFEYAANTSTPSAEQPSNISVHKYEASSDRYISASIRKSGSSRTVLVIWCSCAVTLLQVAF